jgi:2-oxoglutarate dehydrogenase E1 component
MKPVIEKYTQQLLDEGSVTQAEVDQMKSRIMGMLEEEYEASKNYKGTSQEWVSSSWQGHRSPSELASETVAPRTTGVKTDVLEYIGTKAASYPKDFTVHPNLGRVLRAREQSIKEGEGIDWATAESMAFGSLLVEGTHVRLSGQDVERGTFSQRHALLNDQKTVIKFEIYFRKLSMSH